VEIPLNHTIQHDVEAFKRGSGEEKMSREVTINDVSGLRCTVRPECLDPSNETLSERHLRFAMESLESTEVGEKERANAISWAKKAVDSRMGFLLSTLGINPAPLRFPDRVQRCNQAGMLAPRILTKLNRLRNQVEHESHDPDLVDVENFVDIAGLFVFGTQWFVRRFPKQVDFEPRFGEQPFSDWFEPFVSVAMPPRGGILQFRARLFSCDPNSIPEEVIHELADSVPELEHEFVCLEPLHPYLWRLDYSIERDDPEYWDWVRFLLHRFTDQTDLPLLA